MVFLSYYFNYQSEELRKIMKAKIGDLKTTACQTNLSMLCYHLCNWFSREFKAVGIETKTDTETGELYVDLRRWGQYGGREYDATKPHFEIVPDKDGNIVELKVRQITKYYNTEAMNTIEEKFEKRFKKLFLTLGERDDCKDMNLV
jgi:hypothetical protein